jgi:hypothetical protein
MGLIPPRNGNRGTAAYVRSGSLVRVARRRTQRMLADVVREDLESMLAVRPVERGTAIREVSLRAAANWKSGFAGSFLYEFRKLLLRLLHLRHRHVHDVPILRMATAVVLMVLLGGIEGLQFHNLGHNRRMEDPRLIQLLDIRFRDPLLRWVRVENNRPVLRTYIGSLPVELRRIVRDVEENLQQLPIRDLARIVGDLNRLNVAGLSRDDEDVVS